MKLPLLVKIYNGELYHILQFENGKAIAVNHKSGKLNHFRLEELTALTEPEFEAWKAASKTSPAQPAIPSASPARASYSPETAAHQAADRSSA
jgi:hypothetical protein